MDRPPAPGPAARDDDAGTTLSLLDLVRALRRRWKLFGGIAAGVVAGVMALTFLITPRWESEGSIRIKDRQGQGLGGGLSAMVGGLEDAVPGGLPLPELGGTDVQTEIGVLASRRIVEPVVDSLALHVSLSRPWRAYRTEVLRVLEAGEDAPEGVFTLERGEDGGYAVSSRGTEEPVALPEGAVAIGEPFRVGPMRFALEAELAEDPPDVVRFEVIPFRKMMRNFREDLDVQRNDASSRLVELGYRHADPHLARGVINGILERFMAYSERVNKSESARRADILEDEVAAYADRLHEAEARLEAYQEREGIVAPEEQAVKQVERIAGLQVEHDAMRVEKRALAEVIEQARSGEPGPGAETPYRRLATFPSFITNEAVQELLATLTELENQRAELLVRRTEENRDVRALRNRIRQIEEQLLSLATDYQDGLDTQIASADSALARFQDELSRIPDVILEYTRRRREQEVLGEVYVVLRAQLAEARVQEAVDDARIRLVDRGVIEDRPAFPRPEISLALSGVLGLMMGLFGVVVAETASPNVRNRRHAEGAADAPLLGAVPDFSDADGGRSRTRRPLLLRAPWHPASEAVRGVAVALLARAEDPGIVLVAGPEPGDGRTAVASNLAAALARQGVETALLDGDLRQGELHALFGLDPEPGWLDIARSGGAPAEAARRADAGDGAATLDLFGRGAASVHPLEALTSEAVGAFLAGLRERYRAVVVDTPALAEGHDAAALARHADRAILVARNGRTAKEALADAATTLRRGGATVDGVVLNQAEAREAGLTVRKRKRG